MLSVIWQLKCSCFYTPKSIYFKKSPFFPNLQDRITYIKTIKMGQPASILSHYVAKTAKISNFVAFKHLKPLVDISPRCFNCGITLKNSYNVSWFHSCYAPSLYSVITLTTFSSMPEIGPCSFTVGASVIEIFTNMLITSFFQELAVEV